MAITTGSHPKDLWPGVKRRFGTAYAEKALVFAQIFEQTNSDKAYEEVVEHTGFGLASVKSEGAAISYDTTSQGATTRFTNVTYGLGAIVTREAIEDNQYENVASKKAAMLARSMRLTKETVHGNILNRGFNSNFPGGDGKELFAGDHPSLVGNQRNEPAVAADLSEASLEDMLILIRGVTDSRGLRIMASGQKLVVPASLSFEATRIVSSVNQSGTANNDINAMRAMGLLPGGVVIWDYLTDVDAWFVTTDVPDGLMTMNRRAVALSQDNDFDTENARMKATERYSCGWGDWRGVFGSEGA